MKLSAFLVIAVVGLMFLIATGYLVRLKQGRAAERRFWLMMFGGLVAVGVVSYLAHWMLPEPYGSTVSRILTFAILMVSLPMFNLQNKPPG
jgi:hypothetical protein